MTRYQITVEKVVGIGETRERFVIPAASDAEAWDKAVAEWHRFGPLSAIVDVQIESRVAN